jgi:hypothetical protein
VRSPFLLFAVVAVGARSRNLSQARAEQPGFRAADPLGDTSGYKASNPVVSPDGKRIASQSARSNEPAGVGHGIFLMELK